eukprot:TRINITY_DN33586_c0_g1_i1.p1 TRINITY_DN33586_c0_g1~~TRINITY_DN33586_c0_g1_i1.p1  ORF type:complete len:374 (+),score=70.15 TRINITY_DN33586_c0_g1_i1:283-1404(+)
MMNLTTPFMQLGISPWQAEVVNGIVELTDLALGMRIICSLDDIAAEAGLPVEDVGGDIGRHECPLLMLKNWQSAWCRFGRRVRAAMRALPEAGHVVSAIGTSVARILTESLPEAIRPPLVGLAAGGLELETAITYVENNTFVYVAYTESAMLLGEEMLRHGTDRVASAVFHGEACNTDLDRIQYHRSVVLLWALQQAGLRLEAEASAAYSAQSGVPDIRVVELGVNSGDNAGRLLDSHAALRYMGVDSYEADRALDLDGGGETGKALLKKAQSRLQRHMESGRARLVVARTAEAATWQQEAVDVLFVDGDHSLEGVRADLEAWLPLVRSGGIIAGHDYSRKFRGVARAVHSMLPPEATLHLAPDMVFWWQVPD